MVSRFAYSQGKRRSRAAPRPPHSAASVRVSSPINPCFEVFLGSAIGDTLCINLPLMLRSRLIHGPPRASFCAECLGHRNGATRFTSSTRPDNPSPKQFSPRGEIRLIPATFTSTSARPKLVKTASANFSTVSSSGDVPGESHGLAEPSCSFFRPNSSGYAQIDQVPHCIRARLEPRRPAADASRKSGHPGYTSSLTHVLLIRRTGTIIRFTGGQSAGRLRDRP